MNGWYGGVSYENMDRIPVKEAESHVIHVIARGSKGVVQAKTMMGPLDIEQCRCRSTEDIHNYGNSIFLRDKVASSKVENRFRRNRLQPPGGDVF